MTFQKVVTQEVVGRIEELDSSADPRTYILNYNLGKSVVKKWEYHWVWSKDLTARGMNALGSEGWEFVGLLDSGWAIFKRPELPGTPLFNAIRGMEKEPVDE